MGTINNNNNNNKCTAMHHMLGGGQLPGVGAALGAAGRAGDCAAPGRRRAGDSILGFPPPQKRARCAYLPRSSSRV